MTSQTSENKLSSSLQCKYYPIEADNSTIFYPFIIQFDINYEDLPLTDHKNFMNQIIADLDNVEPVFASLIPIDNQQINYNNNNSYDILSEKEKPLLSLLIITHEKNKIMENLNAVEENFDSFSVINQDEDINIQVINKSFSFNGIKTAIGLSQQKATSINSINHQNLVNQRSEINKNNMIMYILFGVIGILAMVFFYFIIKKRSN